MKKRLLLLLCLIATAGSAAWAGIIAQNTFSSGGSWKITDDGELYVDAVTIPYYSIRDMGGYNGTSAPWYGYMQKITSVRFSSRVQTIGGLSFAYLYRLRKVTFDTRSQANVIIKASAFYKCFELRWFDFSYVTEIGPRAFQECLLSHVVLPAVTKIYDFAFAYNRLMMMSIDSYSGYSIYITSSSMPTLSEYALCHRDQSEYNTYYYHHGFLQSGYPWNETYTITWWSGGRYVYNPTSSGTINLERKKYTVLLSPSTTYYDQIQEYAEQLSQLNNGRKPTILTVGIGGLMPDIDTRTDVTAYWMLVGDRFSINTGAGPMPDFNSPSDAPWHSLRSRIGYVDITSATVGKNAFRNCPIHTYEFSNNLKEIHDYAFAGCARENVGNKKTLHLSNVEKIGNNAFSGCNTFYEVLLDNAKEIGVSAFADCKTIEKVNFGHYIKNIASKAFANAFRPNVGYGYNDVYAYFDAPNTAADAFEGLGNVTLHVPASRYASYYTNSAYSKFQFDKIFDFPVKGVRWELTADGTFTYGDTHWDGVIPDYENITDQPWFPYREYIRRITFYGDTKKIGKNAFAFEDTRYSRIGSIDAKNVKEIGENAFKNNEQLHSFSSEKIQKIGDYAFAGCSHIENYTFGSDLKSIGSHAFDGCKNVDVMALTAANPPDVTAETFKGMGASAGNQGARRKAAGTGQKSVTLDVPDEYLTKYLANPYWRLFSFYAGEYGSIVDSGNFGDGLWILYDNGTMVVSADKGPGNSYAEGSAQALGFGTTSDPRSAINLTKRVEFMGNITHLGWGFQHFPNLESVQLCPSIMRLDDTFESCPKLTAINLENVDTIGDWTFARSGVQNVSLPRASYIGRGAFYRCQELQTVSLGTSCEIKEQAFFYCDKMTDINLADAHLDGAKECFSSCYKLKNVTFSGKYLPSRIFSNCFALERIDLGTRVDSISFDAFDGCSALNTVYCANPTPPAMPWGKRKIGEEYYDAQAFYGRNLKNIHLYLPAGFQFPYSKADVWKGMTFETDLSYTEDLLPTGGAVGEDGTWHIDTDGTLTIDFEGGSSSVNIGGSNIGWHDLLASWMPFLTKVVVSDRVNYVPYHMAGEHDPAWSAGVESVELGASVKTLQDQSLNYSGIKDVYCYAESCPSCSRTAFNWDAIAANNATLHVVTSQGVLERYQNSQTWSKFPNIVADLTSRMPAGIFSVTNPEGLVMWFRVTDEAAKTCETYHNDVVGKAIEYNSYGHYEKITVPATVTYNGDTYKVTGIGDNSFYGCTNVDTFILPEGLEIIGVNAFNYCFGVHEFTLPASVQYIGEYAFEMWTNIERLTVSGTTPPTVDENFMNTYWDPDLRPKPTLLVPDGCRDAWNVEPWNKWFNVVDPFNKGVLTYKVIPGASFYDYYQNDEEYMCIEGLMALGIITYQDEMVGREWDELIGDWNEIWGNVYYNKNGKKLFYLDDESRIRIFDGVSSADNIYYEFKAEDYETMMYTTGRNVDLYKGAAIIFPESNVQTDIYFTATNADGIDISYRVLDLSKKTCEVKADPNGYGSNAVATDVSEVKVPYLADGYVVTGIAADAFNSLSSLQSVTLPMSIRTIGANAFGSCENVTGVFINAEFPPMLLDQDGFLTDENNYAFENIGVPAGTGIGGAMLYVPSGSEELYNVYPWNYWFNMGIATDPDGIEDIKSLTPALSKGEGAWYSLDGRKLGSKPTKAGLYINGGKKVVIK